MSVGGASGATLEEQRTGVLSSNQESPSVSQEIEQSFFTDVFVIDEKIDFHSYAFLEAVSGVSVPPTATCAVAGSTSILETRAGLT